MTYKLSMIASVLLVAGCGASEPDIAAAFPDLQENHMEVRLGNMPELGEGQCNRNMYAGFRSGAGETVKLSIDLAAFPDGASMQRSTLELVLEAGSREGFVVGQMPLFAETLSQSCREVDLKMLTMRCTYGPNEESRACPIKIKWEWLQGFKMIEIPKAG